MYNGNKPNELNGIVRAVVHQQIQSGEKGSGDHAHVIIGKYTNDGKYLRDLQKKGVLHVAKISFNTAVRKTLGVDHQSYIANKNYIGFAKKRVPKWKVDAAKELDNLNLTKQRYELVCNKILKQAEKWLVAFEQGDFKQLNRQYNRIDKELIKFSENEFNEKSVDDSNNKIAQLIDKLTSDIDRKSTKRKLPKIAHQFNCQQKKV